MLLAHPVVDEVCDSGITSELMNTAMNDFIDRVFAAAPN